MPTSRLKEYLDTNHIRYVTITHSLAYTAGGIAQITHIPGKLIAKTVMVIVDGLLAMAVVPGPMHVDLRAMKAALGAEEIEIASERQFAHVFPDCELGAMPPFGNLYNLPVYVDEELTKDKEIAFNAGTHRELIRLEYEDFGRLVAPQVLRIGTRTPAELHAESRRAS
ncbi:MAG TPA: YbaK/EbsC family protein [Clostridia bacterium]|nr:YbaK/EbsC family protein [Clostridia bacterium]